jgi:crossover junction endodeoxyribonuclease RusA
VRITVAGIPAPQGSKRHVGGGRMVEQSRAVGPWREAVRAETQRAVAALGSFATSPVTVRIVFRLPRPKSAPASVRWPAKRPDLDKLCRAVLDGLVEGGAAADDSQVVGLFAQKTFASPTYGPGCDIDVEGL